MSFIKSLADLDDETNHSGDDLQEAEVEESHNWTSQRPTKRLKRESDGDQGHDDHHNDLLRILESDGDADDGDDHEAHDNDDNGALQFILGSGVDEKAERAFLDCSRDHQLRIMNLGGLTHAENPSAALVARIGKTRSREEPHYGEGSEPSWKGSPSWQQSRGGGQWKEESQQDGFKPSWNSGSSWQTSRFGDQYTKESDEDVINFIRDVTNFIRESGVDEKAEKVFLDCSRDHQLRVMERGTLRNADNPSAALISRIGKTRSREDWTEESEDVIKFIRDMITFMRESNVDEKAEQAFLECPRDQQCRILQQGTLSNADNPSSALTSRIKKTRSKEESTNNDGGKPPWTGTSSWQQSRDGAQWTDESHGRSSSQTTGGRWPDESDKDVRKFVRDALNFIRESRIDEKAEQAFLDCSHDHQLRIMDNFTLSHADNPSAALMSRIGKTRSQEGWIELEQFDEDTLKFVKDVIQFIKGSGADEKAEQAFLECSRDQQLRIMDDGLLSSANNPSAVLMSRIKKTRSKEEFTNNDECEPPWTGTSSLQPSKGGAQWTEESNSNAGRDWSWQGGSSSQTAGRRWPDESDKDMSKFIRDALSFIREGRVDEKAERAFLECSRSHQSRVIEKGPISNAENPSAALISRIGKTRSKEEWTDEADADMMKFIRDVIRFIRESGVDEKAEQAFFECCHDHQLKIIEEGIISSANNPSALLQSRIKYTRSKLESNKDRNRDEASQHGGSSWQTSKTAQQTQDSDEDVKEFIRDAIKFLSENSVDAKAEQRFLDCTLVHQLRVMEKGSLSDADNPSAALISRIGKTRSKDDRTDDSDEDLMKYIRNVISFVRENSLDERAERALLACSREHQLRVLEDSNLGSAKNPSALLISRINKTRSKDASQREELFDNRDDPTWNSDSSWQKSRSRGQRTNERDADVMNWWDKVTNFFRENSVDEAAERAFLECSREHQMRIMDEGVLTSAGNPSALLISRIKKTRSKEEPGKNRDENDPPWHDRSSWQTSSTGRQWTDESDEDVMAFIREAMKFLRESSVDEKAEKAFLECSRGHQLKIIEVGSLSNANNASAALMSRIGKTRSKDEWTEQSDENVMNFIRDVIKFIREGGVDEKAEQAFLECSRAHQVSIMEDCILTTANNPSALLISRIKKTKSKETSNESRGDFDRQMHGRDKSWDGGSSWQTPKTGGRRTNESDEHVLKSTIRFIRENVLDDKAEQAFLDCSPEQRLRIMEEGSLLTADNPSAALISRIKRTKWTH